MQVFDFSGEYSLYTVFKLLYGGFMKNHLISSLKHLFAVAAVFFLLLPLCSCNQSCSLENSGKTPVSSLSVLNWNVETFFDANFDGTEYSDFKSSTSTWNESKYIKRLERVAEVIKASDCDVIIMEELEKKEQLFDIYNRLCSSFNFSRLYNYGTFAKEENSAIGIGILSRYPLSNVTVHSLDIRSFTSPQPSLRPIVEFYVSVKETPLLIIANHWKSKNGGAEQTEIWRNKQENLLSMRIEKALKKGIKVLATGDFNKDIYEFKKIKGKTQSCNIELRGEHNIQIFSPWYENGSGLYTPGSYYFNNQWERIDHFFTAGGAEIKDFQVFNEGPWAAEEGFPLRYSIKYGTGYSDHFPIKCRVFF